MIIGLSLFWPRYPVRRFQFNFDIVTVKIIVCSSNRIMIALLAVSKCSVLPMAIAREAARVPWSD